MTVLVALLVVVGALALVGLSLSLRIVKQYEVGVVFRLGRVVAVKPPGLVRIVPVVDVIRRVSMRVVTRPIELKDIQLPESMQRAMARQAEAEREKRAKIIAAEGERLAADALGAASDVMVAHPLALQLRNLQTLVEIGADKNTTVIFPAPLMSTIQELGTFLAQDTTAVATKRAPTGLRVA